MDYSSGQRKRMDVVIMESYDDISRLIREGVRDFSEYGRINTSFYGDELIKLSYSASAIYEGEWTWLELHSRGHIYELKTGKLIALPFDKFFNIGEDGHYPNPDAYIVDVTEKMDGTLGIGYFWNGEWRISTRGSFESPQAVWATEFLQKNYPEISELPSFLTPIFEIIYPDNYYLSDLVIDYGDTEDLYLIGLRNCINFEDYFFAEVEEIADRFGFVTPWVYNFENIDALMESRWLLSDNEEGWVVRMSDGSRYKVKGQKYIEAHKMASSFSKKRVFEMFAEDMIKIAEGGVAPVGEFLSGDYFDIPNDTYPVLEKHTKECREYLQEFARQFIEQISHWHNVYRSLCYLRGDRGEFARKAISMYGDDAHILFALWDGKAERFVELIMERMRIGID